MGAGFFGGAIYVWGDAVMAKSNKPIFWSLFAAGGTLAAFLAPVLVLLFLLASVGYVPTILTYSHLQQFASIWLSKIFLFGVIGLFLWHAAHRLRVTLHDLGLRQDQMVAYILYFVAAVCTIWTAVILVQI